MYDIVLANPGIVGTSATKVLGPGKYLPEYSQQDVVAMAHPSPLALRILSRTLGYSRPTQPGNPSPRPSLLVPQALRWSPSTGKLLGCLLGPFPAPPILLANAPFSRLPWEAVRGLPRSDRLWWMLALLVGAGHPTPTCAGHRPIHAPTVALNLLCAPTFDLPPSPPTSPQSLPPVPSRLRALRNGTRVGVASGSPITLGLDDHHAPSDQSLGSEAPCLDITPACAPL
jgi:hypothetical protein